MGRSSDGLMPSRDRVACPLKQGHWSAGRASAGRPSFAASAKAHLPGCVSRSRRRVVHRRRCRQSFADCANLTLGEQQTFSGAGAQACACPTACLPVDGNALSSFLWQPHGDAAPSDQDATGASPAARYAACSKTDDSRPTCSSHARCALAHALARRRVARVDAVPPAIIAQCPLGRVWTMATRLRELRKRDLSKIFPARHNSNTNHRRMSTVQRLFDRQRDRCSSRPYRHVHTLLVRSVAIWNFPESCVDPKRLAKASR